MNLEQFTFVGRLLAITDFASVLRVDNLAFALAIWASLLDLLDHGTQLTEDSLDTLTTTRLTSLDCPLFSTLAVTLGTKDALL